MVAVVVPLQSRAEPLVTVSRVDALRLATPAAVRVERELAVLEDELVREELTKRERWNQRWFVRLLPFLRSDARREAIDVWDVGGGDVLPNLDNVFYLNLLSYHANKLRKLAYRAQHTSSSELQVEQSVSNQLF
jgi:hypothetical protein